MTVLQFTGERVWRPYDDDPLITREMISGLGACDPEVRNRLLCYLEALVARRSVPVHTAVAFNGVYFGYDIAAGGYVGGPLDIGDFPSVALGDRVGALPVGAMINIRTAGDLLPAEIVYKEGAHPALGTYGETPAWLSGAPADAQGPGRLTSDRATDPVLRERLVFDTTAFGQDPAPTANRLQRLRRQGRTDEFEHLVVESRYAMTDAALGDADYYAQYLVTHGRDQLTSALAPAPLPSLIASGSSEDELLAAVRGLMGAVREALASLEAVRVWGSTCSPATRWRKDSPAPVHWDVTTSGGWLSRPRTTPFRRAAVGLKRAGRSPCTQRSAQCCGAERSGGTRSAGLPTRWPSVTPTRC